MEADNILLTKRGDIVSRLFKSYSTSKEDRDNLIKQLLSAKNPMNISVKIADGKSINRQILEKYLMIPELSLEDTVYQAAQETDKKN